MVIVPDSDIILIKSPLKLDNNNQITFANANDQYNYFISLPHLEYDGCTYQRKDGIIRFETNENLRFEDLLNYNYCMYKNKSYSNKWFYAFITDITYINDGLTTIKIDTDTFQTWQFDLIYKNSFVEREIVAKSNDIIGNHTIPEGLNTGEYIIESASELESSLNGNKFDLVGVTWLPSNTPFYSTSRYYGGIYSGVNYLIFKDGTSVGKFIQAIDDIGRDSGSTIVSISTIPESMVSNVEWLTGDLGNQTGITFALLPNMTNKVINNSDIVINSPTTFETFTPKNAKVYCYPYNYLSITNNAGTQADFRYEDFINNTPTFDVIGLVTSGNSIYVNPKNYKKCSTAKSGWNWGFPVTKFPQGSWNNDNYTNWLTQNGINILGVKIDASTSQAIGGSVEALIGAGTKSVEGIGSGLGKMLGAIQSNYKASMIPNTIAGQTNSGDITYAYGKISPTVYKMTIREEYARIIDSFFSLYGYKVNTVKTPNIHQRSNWDFIKTSDINLEGDIPENDLDKIRNLFNNGCTFWHTTTYYLDYSQNNN